MFPLKVVVEGTLIGAISPPKSFEQLKVAVAAKMKTSSFFMSIN
jgi:hypothetical protein